MAMVNSSLSGSVCRRRCDAYSHLLDGAGSYDPVARCDPSTALFAKIEDPWQDESVGMGGGSLLAAMLGENAAPSIPAGVTIITHGWQLTGGQGADKLEAAGLKKELLERVFC